MSYHACLMAGTFHNRLFHIFGILKDFCIIHFVVCICLIDFIVLLKYQFFELKFITFPEIKGPFHVNQ